MVDTPALPDESRIAAKAFIFERRYRAYLKRGNIFAIPSPEIELVIGGHLFGHQPPQQDILIDLNKLIDWIPERITILRFELKGLTAIIHDMSPDEPSFNYSLKERNRVQEEYLALLRRYQSVTRLLAFVELEFAIMTKWPRWSRLQRLRYIVGKRIMLEYSENIKMCDRAKSETEFVGFKKNL